MEPCFNVLTRQPAPPWIVEGDIRACFDGISHAWVWAHIPMEQALLQQWLTAGFVEKQRLHPTEAGARTGALAPL